MFRTRARRWSAVIATATMVLLAACGSDENPRVTIAGELAFPEQTSLPEKAIARVTMFEPAGDGSAERIVAERSLHELAKTPIPFKLEVARNLISTDSEYRLGAQIMSEEGEVVWHTPSPQRIDPETRKKNLRLLLEANKAVEQLSFQKYRCEDGFHLAAARDEEQVIVRLGNRRLVLESGAAQGSFSDTHGNSIKIKGADRIVRVDGEEHEGCTRVSDRQPEPAENASIRPAAEQRDVGLDPSPYRTGVGSEAQDSQG